MRRDPEKLWNPYVAGVALGLVLTAAFVVAGHGLGASGALGRVVAAGCDWVAPSHVDANPYLAQSAGADRDPFDHWIVWTVVGVLLGGLVAGLTAGRVRLETLGGPHLSTTMRLVAAFGGGALVGYGARLARGCTSGQALSGGAMLSVGSWAFMFSVFIGGYAIAYLVRRLWN